MDENFSLTLHEELDKRYRNIKRIPDFLVHFPGKDKMNFAALEFKSTKSGVRWIKYDLEKLDKFINSLKYRVGILVIFGKKSEFKRIYNKLQESSPEILTKHEIIFYDVDTGKAFLINNSQRNHPTIVKDEDKTQVFS